MKPERVIELAKKHLGEGSMRGSAGLCLSDAEYLLDFGMPGNAYHRALQSLCYSVGVFHPDYQLAINQNDEEEN